MNEREKSGARRNDLIDTLLELKTEDKNKVFSNTDVGLSLYAYFCPIFIY